MSLTLDPILATAQNNQVRHPIIDLVAKAFGEDIPFDGQFLTLSSLNEQNPVTIMHSTGRLLVAYQYDSTKIKYAYTDISRTEFTFIEFSIGLPIYDLAMVELADHNIGIVYFITSGGNYILYRKIISPLGVVISTAQMTSWATSVFTDGPTVVAI
jgi:hypothetical protein